MTILILFYINSFLSSMAIMFVMVGAAHPHIFHEDVLIKYGAIIGCFGLTGQILRNLQFMATGLSPADSEFPLWMFKDLGLCLMIFGYAVRGSLGEKVISKLTPRPKPIVKGKK